MSFGWINGINLLAVACLILINIVALRKGLAGDFRSKYLVVNILEQIGRYGCMTFMILPIFTDGWKFGFKSVPEMLIWACTTIVLLICYIILWVKKARGGRGVLYGLAIVPVILFFLNGVLLRHFALVITSLVFGTFHLEIVWENVGS